MDSQSLKPWQAKRIAAVVRPAAGYLHRLQRRMEGRGFPPGDKLYQLVLRASDAVQALYVELNDLGCTGGVGRPSRPGCGDDAHDAPAKNCRGPFPDAIH